MNCRTFLFVAAVASLALGDASPAAEPTEWQFELKRQATDRGTESESTSTTLRLERLVDGPIDLLRLDAPFPDEKQSFSGDLFSPHLGDIKLRMGFRAIPVGDVPIGSFVEAAFPTASPESLGSGKYQITVGVHSASPLPSMVLGSGRWKFAWLVEQVFSVAGDPERADVDYTKFELGLLDAWSDGKAVKLTFKPVIDWEQDGRTGAVLELEGGMPLSARWSGTLMVGGRLWGEGVKGTYGKRLELTARCRF